MLGHPIQRPWPPLHRPSHLRDSESFLSPQWLRPGLLRGPQEPQQGQGQGSVQALLSLEGAGAVVVGPLLTREPSSRP